MTAVEWLLDEINKLTGLTINSDEPIVEQAKQMEKNQTEISDEEIRKQGIKYDNQALSETPIAHFIEGAKWYREQLKKK